MKIKLCIINFKNIQTFFVTSLKVVVKVTDVFRVRVVLWQTSSEDGAVGVEVSVVAAQI